jgi:DNA modification methylase
VNIRDRIKELRRVPADQLQPNPKNWRKHPEAQANALRGVLAEVGIASAVLARETPEGGLMLIDGHLRTETLHNAEIPVLVLDVSEEEADKILATFDPLGAMAESDADALRALLEDVETGSQELADMLTALAEDAGILDSEDAAEIVEDEIPEPPVDPITKPGDLWILGDHRLLCGDSTKAEDVERLMAGAKADLCFTSPPYNSKDGGYKTDYSGKTKKFYNHQCDDRTEDEWVEFCNNVLSLASSHLKSEDSPVIWNVMYTAHCRSGYGRTMFAGAHGLSVKETICWDKGAGFPTASRGILSRNWELVFVLSKGNKYTTTQGENEPRWAKWDIPRPKQQEEHKATFPVDLAARAMCDFGAKGDSVYEPFCGSGTTLIAAEQLGRKCYGMEISPQYCDVIVKRWETLTGRKAERRESDDQASR